MDISKLIGIRIRYFSGGVSAQGNLLESEGVIERVKVGPSGDVKLKIGRKWVHESDVVAFFDTEETC